MKAIIFPGQGSQKVGMGGALAEASTEAAALFDRANQTLGYDLRTLCLDGPAEELTETLHAQPALLTVGVMAYRAAVGRGIQAGMAAGHSVGEYAALVAAGALEFEAALRLVQVRARLMAAAPAGAMAALIGLPDEKLDCVLAAARTSGVVVAANFNCPGQVVISGAVDAVEAAMQEAKVQGARMAVKLPVSGAFHSPLVAHAGEALAEHIAAAHFADARIPVYQNTTARPATAAPDLKAALQAQMLCPVRWTDIVRRMKLDGATMFYELGPGNVLAGLIKRIDKDVSVENSQLWESS